MKRPVLAMVVLTAGVMGFGAGAMAGAFFVQRAMFSGAADQDAWDTLERVEVLSRLRLGQTANAIDLLEDPLGDQVLFVASTNPPETSPRDTASFRALLAAKVYLNIFPLTGANAKTVDKALEHVPLLQDRERYTDGVNQLVLRFQPVPLAPAIGI